ncbi:S-layer homology domain-containing protein [Sporosarcina sp. PTS2304]|uniref:S-layer homology domain-containing protein n=1 Tax=Sporosarcina sp. PTS2304 TaxID=2283194 RepID=UPI000E0CEB0B|nr:S-layer homology domain-containing protein [Sporosarcina sp. PTS2304]AXI00354.1 S-layer homology domain-containing protein [Sporosarcina sp. PTS2304]
MNKWNTMIVLATLLCCFSIHTVSAQTVDTKYIDVSDDHWAKNEIMQLDEMKIITGDYDMQFYPEEPLTKGQIAVSLSKIFGSTLQNKPVRFTDINSNSDKTLFASNALENDWLQMAAPGTFGFEDPMTERELWDTLAIAFKLTKHGGSILPKVWPARGDQVTLQTISTVHHMTTEEFLTYGSPLATRAFFSKALHNLLVETNRIKQPKTYTLSTVKKSVNYRTGDASLYLGSVPFQSHPIYIRSEEPITYKDFKRIDYGFSHDEEYTYSVGEDGATITLTVREFANDDVFVFSELRNPSSTAVTVDVLQKETNVASFDLYRFDRYPIMRLNKDTVNADITSYPTGVLRIITTDGSVQERMIGQSYQSKELSMRYDNDEQSVTRELISEQESLSYAMVGNNFLSVYALQANADEVTDHWYVDSKQQLFQSKKNIFNWMRETGQNHRKRNNWYTATGPYNKLAESTEPMPASGQNYGRSLLMLKEDRALTLYHKQKDRYFEDLIYNSFVNLTNFKKDKAYWETEVTSTYLKHLYDIHAPFIDTRFNEQIALFYYNVGKEFTIPSASEPLRKYADLLVSQKRKGNTINVTRDAYYIADYFPINQQVTTHSSMNHMLGGMNILIMAYQEFGDSKYLQTARSIQRAISYDKTRWIRENGDIWYRISPDRTFAGDDYLHLTLEDLIDSYQLWQQVDTSYLPTLKQLIISKANFLSHEKLGYTTKIKHGLTNIGLLKYLPKGDEVTDAL